MIASCMTHEAASENGDDARQFLQRLKDRGLKVTAAFSDYSQSFTEAIKSVYPHARFQADHFHTVNQEIPRSLLPRLPCKGKSVRNRGVSRTMPFLVIPRSLLRGVFIIFDHTHSEAQARIRVKQLRQDINALEDRNLEKILTFFDDHWEQAFRYLRKKGMGKHRRGSNSESGMRLLRRLEKNHDGIRSATTRQHYIQIYQAIKYLSLDIADFLEKGPQMTELPCV